MSNQSEPGLEPLRGVLLDCAATRVSGVLRVSGEPGGAIHLADGGVTAITTPGAPDPEVILLRSGRVPEAGWSAVFAAAAADGQLGAELVRRELIGAGELAALLRLALADAMFALAAGPVDECALEQAANGCLLPVEPAAEPGWLLAEAARRIAVLAALPSVIAHDADRVAAVQGAWTPQVGPGDGRAEILALANGRRTARDMAFVLGRGVYAVTLQLARMCDAGLLVVDSSRAAAARRPGPDPAAAPAADAAVAAGGPDGADGDAASSRPPLPRRRRGGSGPAGTGRSALRQPGQRQPGLRQAVLRQPALRPSAPRQAAGQPEKSSVLRILRPGASRQPEAPEAPETGTPRETETP
jgi:hypothetical protein